MIDLISKIKELRNTNNDSNIQIDSQEMKYHLNKLRSHVLLFMDQNFIYV